MASTTTLRNDPARIGTTPDFRINGNPWRKYVSMRLPVQVAIPDNPGCRVHAGVLVIENWQFSTGQHAGRTSTLVLATTTDNNIYCFSEDDLLTQRQNATPLWHTPLGVHPRMEKLGFSNINPPIGVCGTPVVDPANRRMFVIALSATGDDHVGNGHYTIFELDLDTGAIRHSQELVDSGAAGRVTFHPADLDQRSALNLVNGWLWATFAAIYNFDVGRYYGWIVAINADNLSQQLFQPTISLAASDNFGIYAGGVWGVGGVAAAEDGTVFALTGNATQLDPKDDKAARPNDDLQQFGMRYWDSLDGSGPGSRHDYFNALVRLGVKLDGPTPQLQVLDWFQASDLTRKENGFDVDFGGSSPVVLPAINGRQLVAFVPKDGNVFVLDAQHLGNWTRGLTRVELGKIDIENFRGWTMTAIAYMQTPDGTDLLIAATTTNSGAGGLMVYNLDAAADTPTLTKRWQSPKPLRISFGSPTVIANPVVDPANPPNPVALIWVVDGEDPGNPEGVKSRGSRDQVNVVVRAFDVLSGATIYDSSKTGDVTDERVPHFAPITAGANSVFIPTAVGFMGFTQIPVQT